MFISHLAVRLAVLIIAPLVLALGLGVATDAAAATWDFDGDGRGDVLWQRTDGMVAIWLMNEGVMTAGGVPAVLPAGWRILGAGKFDTGPTSDVLLREPSGDVRIWFMNGVAIGSQGVVGNLDLAWTVARIGDFNGDGQDDTLWWHPSGDVLIWLMNGLTITGQAVIGNVPPVWKIRRVADVDGDGNADIIWRNSTTGEVALWFINGLSVVGSASLGNVPTTWSIEGAADVNADAPDPKADIFWRKNTGELAIWRLDGPTVVESGSPGTVATPAWGVAGLRAVGTNNKADILWRHLTGLVTVWLMDGLNLETMGFPGTAPTDWTILQELQSPEITSANATTFTVGQPGTFTITTFGFPTPAITRGGVGLPPGVNFGDNGDGTATLSGTPDPGTVGTYVFTFTADNGIDPDAVQNPFTLTINQAPGITSLNNVTVAPGVAMSPFTVQTTGDPTNTITRTDNPDGLPSGVSFNDNGNNTATISGTPAAGTQAGSPYDWLITAANGVLPNATQSFAFNVVCPTIDVSGTIPDLVLNQAMTPVTFTQTGGNPAITWSATGLPTGVGINPGTGEVSGTPTQSGPFSATITATDIGNCTGSKIVAFNVNVAPQITSPDNVTVAPGVAMLAFTVQTTGTPTNTITRTDNPGVLPTGVSFNDNGNNTATISGTPAAGTQAASPYLWLITAANGVLPNATQPFTFNVVCPAITVNGTTPLTLTYNVLMTPTTYTNVGGNGAITWSVSGQPAGLGINPGTGELSGTPTQTGTFNATVTATDVGGCIGTKAVTINVDPSAGNDSYNALGNVRVDSSTGPGTPFTVTANDSFPPGTTISTFQNPSANGGTVTMTQTAGATLGRFTYNPPVGFTGNDTFTYTLLSNGRTASGTVTVTMTGKVWFINNNGGACPAAPCDGRMTNPFTSAADFQAVNGPGVAPNPTNGDAIFFYGGGGNYSGAVTLRSSQRLVGQGATGTLATLGNVTVQNGQTLPATGGTVPVLGNTLTVGNGNFIHGMTLSGGTALTGTGFGTLTVNDNMAINSAGRALDLTNGTLNATFNSVTSTGGTNNVNLNTIAGTVNLGTGALSNAGGDAFLANTVTANVTYAGTIASGSARSVNISNKTGGSSVTFSGAVTETDTGISLTNNGGSGGSTITFQGGVSASTGANPAFTATGGGTVNVCDKNPCGTGTAVVNTLATTTGTALNVANTNIGPDGLTFRSISAGTGAGSAGVGISLDNTGTAAGNGSLTVSGTGSAGTGGTIQHKTGADGSTTGGIGIYLNQTKAPSFSWMQLNDFDNFAIRGSSVAGFTLANTVINGSNGNSAAADEGSVRFTGLTGSASVTSSSISGGWEDNFKVVNTAGTLDRLTFSSVTIGANSTTDGNDGIGVEGQAASVMNVTVQNSTFTSSRGDLFQMSHIGTGTADLVFTSNTLSNTHPAIATGGGGVTISNSSTSAFAMNVSSNSFRDAVGHGVLIFRDTGTGTQSITFSNNTIGVSGVDNSGSSEGSALKIQNATPGTITASITGNTIREYNNFGIELLTGGGAVAQNGVLNATVTGNTVADPGNNPNVAVPKNGVHLNGGTVVGDTYQICVAIGGAGALANSITGSGDLGGTDFRLRQRQSTTVRLPGYAGSATDDAAVVAFVQGNNDNVSTPSGLASHNSPPGGGFVGGAACPLP